MLDALITPLTHWVGAVVRHLVGSSETPETLDVDSTLSTLSKNSIVLGERGFTNFIWFDDVGCRRAMINCLHDDVPSVVPLLTLDTIELISYLHFFFSLSLLFVRSSNDLRIRKKKIDLDKEEVEWDVLVRWRE